MSYPEKRTIVSMVAGFALLTAYCIYMVGAYQNGLFAPDDLRFCAKAMLIFIGIGVGVTIVLQILFHIALSVGIAIRKGGCEDGEIEKEINDAAVEDEMDKLIELKAMKVGFIIAGAGMIAGLVSLVVGFPGAVMLNLMYLAMGLGSLAEGAASLYYYRRGVRHA